VTIDRVELVREVDGEEVFDVLVEGPLEFDLLLLQNDVFAVLAEGTFPPGRYEGIRLILESRGGPGNPGGGGFPGGAGPPQVQTVEPNRIVVDDSTFPLMVPSGDRTGI